MADFFNELYEVQRYYLPVCVWNARSNCSVFGSNNTITEIKFILYESSLYKHFSCIYCLIFLRKLHPELMIFELFYLMGF